MALTRFTVNKISNRRFTVPGFGTGGSSPAPAATSYTAVQVFTGSTTWTPPSGVTSTDYLIIGGGGGGGGHASGGGGGAGGYREGLGLSVTSGQSYSLVVGAGGNGGST